MLLQVRQEAAAALVVGVADVVARQHAFAGELAVTGHGSILNCTRRPRRVTRRSGAPYGRGRPGPGQDGGGAYSGPQLAGPDAGEGVLSSTRSTPASSRMLRTSNPSDPPSRAEAMATGSSNLAHHVFDRLVHDRPGMAEVGGGSPVIAPCLRLAVRLFHCLQLPTSAWACHIGIARLAPAAPHACPRSATRPSDKHQDLVRIHHGGQAVRDHQRGAVARTPCAAPSRSPLRAAVQRAGRLVQDQDARVLQDGAGDGHALLLAARQLQAALAHPRVVAVRQAQDEVVDLGQPGGVLDLGLRWRRAVRRRCCSGWCR